MTPSPSLHELVGAAEAEFIRRLGRPPRWVVAAPGRVNLIGEHTDYNDGFVLPMAIDRYVVIAADHCSESSPGCESRICSTAFNEWTPVATAPPLGQELPPWVAYVAGVQAGFLAVGHDPAPFEAVIHANVPLGSGLSSSAALEVATATLYEAMTGQQLEPLQKAKLCQRAEHDYARVPCGIMDQCASVMGREGCLLLLDCRSLDVVWTRLADPRVVTLIINSNVRHALVQGEYASRRQQCKEAAAILGVPSLRDASVERLEEGRVRLGDLLYRRARHVITENDRTLAAARALEQGNWPRVGQLMAASHASLRDDYQVSCPELDALVELTQQLGSGVIGSRMTGGGFGGCTVSLVHKVHADGIARTISEEYLRRTGRTATSFITKAAGGARIM